MSLLSPAATHHAELQEQLGSVGRAFALQRAVIWLMRGFACGLVLDLVLVVWEWAHPGAGSFPLGALGAPPTVGPIILVVMENKEYGQVIGSAEAPYLNQLAADNTLVDQSYAITHPSLPNYLALLGGDTFGITSDCTDCFLDQPNLVDALEAGGRSWTAYMEDLPVPCSLESGAGGYALKHNPFLYFQNIRTDPARCNRVVPLTQLDADLASGRVPDFAWISPNLRHDTHDASVADGDHWIADFVPRILASSGWRDGGLLIITWDEGTSDAGCCGLAAGGHVPTVLVRANGPHGTHVTEPATHYSVLRTIEDLLQVGRAGQSGALEVHALLP